MDRRSEFSHVVLAPRDVFVLNTPDPVEITARRGCVWLTQPGDARDVIVHPGHSFAMSRARDVVITSRGAAELVVTGAKRRASDRLRPGKLKSLAAALVETFFLRVLPRAAGRILASRLQLGPRARAGMD